MSQACEILRRKDALAATIAFHGNVRHSLILSFLLVLRGHCPPTPLLSLQSVFPSMNEISIAKIIIVDDAVNRGGMEVVRRIGVRECGGCDGVVD
ncbi:hypothetical protein ZOSMA_297G00050 [Zostera marina]|uniref:Uncharacterized protein n=1 Tax=Zostera marina TaxID=29655 RepID=A0A0K9PBS0_ZOSMR|nr:hypothetical protein ZOSMA_297G00050 [Zostera marina]